MATQTSISHVAKVIGIGVAGAAFTPVTVQMLDVPGQSPATLPFLLPNAQARNLAIGSSFSFTTTEVQGVDASTLPAHTAGNVVLAVYPASGNFKVAPNYIGKNVGQLSAQFFFRHLAVDTAIANATVGNDGTIGKVNLSTNTGLVGDSLVIKIMDGATEIGTDSVLPS